MSETTAKLAEMKKALSDSSHARKRLTYLFDEGDFTELDAFAKSGENLSGVITAYGYVEGNPVYAFSQDITVNYGALTEVQSAKIKKIYDLAAKTGVPVLGIYDSFGADLSDGIKALSAYGELLMWVSNLSGVVPQISIVAGSCAGTAAMLAVSADFVIATKDAEIFITPNTVSENLAENAAKTGIASILAENDEDAIEAAISILQKLPQNNISPVPIYEFSNPTTLFENNAEAIAESICDAESVIEVYEKFGSAAYTALASIGGASVGICSTNKTDGKLSSDDCSKLARFVRTCDAFAIPVITFVDTEGFEVSENAEVTGIVKDMAKLAHAYSEATTIKIAVVTGNAFGPAYIALAGKGANADLAFALPDAVISALAPETAVEFLYHDKLAGVEDTAAKRAELLKEYITTEASALSAAEKNCLDDIISIDEIRAKLINSLEIMAGKRISRMPKKHSNMPF